MRRSAPGACWRSIPRSAPTRWRSTIWTRRAPSRSKPSSSKPDEPLPLRAPSRSAPKRSRHTRFASCAASSRACFCTRAPNPARRSASYAWCHHPFRCSHSLFCKMFHVKHSFAHSPGGGADEVLRGRVAPAAGCPRRLSAPRAAASAPPVLVFGPVLQVFRLRGKQLPRTGLFTGRFASTSGRSDRASRGAEAKPLVANDVLCHEVEKLARAALFPASAAFAPVRSGQNYLGRRRSPSPPAGGKGARHDRGLHVKWGVGTFVRMVYCQRRKEEACGGSP